MVGRKSKISKGIQPEIQTLISILVTELCKPESQTLHPSRASTLIFCCQQKTHMLQPGCLLITSSLSFPPNCLKNLGLSLMYPRNTLKFQKRIQTCTTCKRIDKRVQQHWLQTKKEPIPQIKPICKVLSRE